MMMPRLKLWREPSEDGAIFVSIDYNEESHLRMLMDEVFGEENYRNTFVAARVKKIYRKARKYVPLISATTLFYLREV